MGRLERLARLREMDLPASLPSALSGLDVRRLARLRQLGFLPPWAGGPLPAQRLRRPPVAVSVLAVAAGALAVGAVAIGSIAIGAVAIGRLRLKEARIERLVVDDLTVTRLHRPEAAEAAGDEAGEPAPEARVPDA
jgi:hypothetical protein